MIRIVTDSNADLSPAQAEHFGISGTGYSYVNFGDKSYRTQLDLNADQFHDMLKGSAAFPKTSAPSVGDFVDVFEKLKGDEVISIHTSRDLSGTIGSAETAASMLGNDPRVTVIDTRMVNAGQVLFIAEARRLIDAGKSVDEIKAHLDALTPRCRMHIVFDTLENLKRGGRVGGAQAFIGGLLQMKPILSIKNGKIEPLERVRTMNKAVARLKEIVTADLKDIAAPSLMIIQAAAPQAAAQLAADLAATLNIATPMIIEAGPAVATHSGPGALGAAYFV
jgi:DegV family protein with EDD domain